MPTKIEWTDETWNPVTGCTKVSTGCKNCYAERLAKRFWGERKFTDVRCHPERLEIPLHWKKPRRIFVCSMSDFFHVEIPVEFQAKIFSIIKRCPQHTFQILTKRPELAVFMDKVAGIWEYSNMWLGVTVENQEAFDRIHKILHVSTAIKKFVSFEPLLELPRGSLEGIDWVIVGAETGAGARYMSPDWAREIRDVCLKSGIPFFMKKMSNNQPIPNDLMIREYPQTVIAPAAITKT